MSGLSEWSLFNLHTCGEGAEVHQCPVWWWEGSDCGSDVYAQRLCCCLKPRSSGGWDSSLEISAFQVEDGPWVTLLLIRLRGKRPSNLEICTWSCCGNFQQQTFSFISSSVCVFICVDYCWGGLNVLRVTPNPQSGYTNVWLMPLVQKVFKCRIQVLWISLVVLNQQYWGQLRQSDIWERRKNTVM